MEKSGMDIFTFINSYLVFIILFVIFFGFMFIFIKFIFSKTLHKNHKFNVFLNLISAFGAVALAATLFLTLYSNEKSTYETEFQNYNTIWDKHAQFIQQFIDHPEMEYFHADLYGRGFLNKGTHYKRNITLERNLFDILMNSISTVIIYLDSFKYIKTTNKTNIKDRLDKLLSLHVKSKYFLEYWREYKKFNAQQVVKDYMQENFNV